MIAECLIPDRAVLCAIGYHVVATDNMVLFSAEPGVAGCYTRMMFTRNCGCWYVELLSGHVGNIEPSNKIMVSHVMAAQGLINEWFGGNHDCPRGENRP